MHNKFEIINFPGFVQINFSACLTDLLYQLSLWHENFDGLPG